MNALAALLAYAALAALALGMTRHHRTVFGRDLPPRRRTSLRLAGGCLLALAFVADLHAQGPELGPVAWCAQLAVAGLALTLLLALRPSWWAAPLALLAVLALL